MRTGPVSVEDLRVEALVEQVDGGDRSAPGTRGDLSERSPNELDDVRDREELRRRYSMLLQELRVLLPGVQLLVAFLLTAPFAQGFDRVDDTGRVLYGIALTSGLLAILAFTAPIALHRFGQRRARSARLQLGITTTRGGIALVGVSLLCAFAVILRILYTTPVVAVMVVAMTVAMLATWVALPQLTRTHDDDETRSRSEDR
jgi:hypothetical protein